MQLLLYCKGAQSYGIIIVDRYGRHAKTNGGVIAGQEVCAWDASNEPFGEYYATLQVVDCNGQTHHYTFTILVACSNNMVAHVKGNDLPVYTFVPAYIDSLKNVPAEHITERLSTYAVPNPLNDDPEIVYQLPDPGKVTLRIYTQDARLVQVVEEDQQHDAGAYRVKFDARRLPQGMSYYQFEYTDTQGRYHSRYVRILK